MEVFADLPDDPREGGPEQLLHVVRPRAVPVVCLQVVNPLKGKKEIEEEKFSLEAGGINTPVPKRKLHSSAR